MLQPRSSFGLSILIAITLAVVAASACHRRQQTTGNGEGETELSGEPEQYSATIVRTVDDGTSREPSITHEARSGEKRREEWIEDGHNRALIWRPDLERAYLLDLDERLYVELETTPHRDSEFQAEAKHQNGETPKPDSANGLVQMVDRWIDDPPLPTAVETRMLPASVIDGRSCKVYEHRASFPDGHSEITRAFRASDLAGLALRIESESEPATTKVTTERREVRLDVSPDAFVVPAEFKKVDRLARFYH